MRQDYEQNVAKAIIVIDGDCALCQQVTKFLVRYDKRQRFLFATLQSEVGQHLLLQYHLPPSYEDSFLLIDEKKQRMLSHSTAALQICRRLGGGWSLLYLLIVIPPVVRDTIYRFVATSRHRLFASSDHCLLRTPAIQNRFIDTLEQLDRIR